MYESVVIYEISSNFSHILLIPVQMREPGSVTVIGMDVCKTFTVFL